MIRERLEAGPFRSTTTSRRARDAAEQDGHPAPLVFLRFAPGQSEPSFQWWRAHVHPDDVERVIEGLERHAKNGDGVWRDEYRFRRGDGSWAIIVDRGVLQRSAAGDPVRMAPMTQSR